MQQPYSVETHCNASLRVRPIIQGNRHFEQANRHCEERSDEATTARYARSE